MAIANIQNITLKLFELNPVHTTSFLTHRQKAIEAKVISLQFRLDLKHSLSWLS
jgi:hypothetical protein